MRGDVLVGEDRADGVPEPVAHFAELEKARAGTHPEAGAEQQCQTKRPPHHAIDGIVHLRDHLDHSLFPPIHKTKADRTHQRLCPQNSERSHFPQPGCAAFPGCAPLRKDDGSVLLPERYSRFPCGLTPSAPTLQAGLLQSARSFPAVHVFSVLPAHSCAR